MAKKKQPEKVTSAASPNASNPTIPAGMAPITRYQKFEARTVHRSQLLNAPYNPNRMSPQEKRKLRQNIKKNGFIGGIVWNELTGNIVGGHHRIGEIDALEESQDYSITVDVVQLTDVQEREINISLNNRAAQGQFDQELLAECLIQIQDAGGDVLDAGFSKNDLEMILGTEFFSQAFREQTEIEKPQVDLMFDIKSAGQEAAKASKQSQQSQDPLPSTGDTSPAPPRQPLPVYQPPAGQSPDSSQPQPELSLSQQSKGITDWTSPEGNALLRKKRNDYIEKRKELDAADTMVTFVFDSPSMVPRFIRAFDLLPEDKRYFDGVKFADELGVDLMAVDMSDGDGNGDSEGEGESEGDEESQSEYDASGDASDE